MKFYRTSEVDTGEYAQTVLNWVLIIILAISGAALSIFAAINVIFRLPDFYRYEFDRTEVSSNLDLSVDSTNLGSFFSDFMIHVKNPFTLVAEYEGISRNYFTNVEADLMENFRMILNVTLIIAIVALLITAFLIIIMMYNKMARNLRISLNISLAIYIISIAGLSIYFNVFNGDIALRNSLMSGKFGADDLLQQMFDGRFTLDSTVAVIVISLIIMMLIRYIVWRMTAQKGIFSEGLRGASK